MAFDEDLLFTHRGLSGSAVLQISSYWQEGTPLTINSRAHGDLAAALAQGSALAQADCQRVGSTGAQPTGRCLGPTRGRLAAADCRSIRC